jgi:hypothetical protein
LANGESAEVSCPTCRFNLLREESEGYAKLATLLNQQAAGRLSPEGTAAAVRLLAFCCVAGLWLRPGTPA